MTTATESTVGKLSAQVRTGTGKGMARKLRSKGLIPAVVYGKNQEAIALTVDPKALSLALDPAKKQNTVIDLTVEDGGSNQQVTVMVKDYQVHPLRMELLHADFVQVELGQPVDVTVPLVLNGKPEGVKLGGTLHQVFRDLPLSCPPREIPAAIEVDVSALQLNDSLQVKDLPAPSSGKINLAESRTVALVMAPKKVADEEAEGEGEEAEGEEAEGAEGAAEEKKE